MRKPTVEEIEGVIRRRFGVSYDLDEAAQEIQALFTPTYKPLSELHLDREACIKVVLAIDNKWTLRRRGEKEYGTRLIANETGSATEIEIQVHNNGGIFVEKQWGQDVIYNPFKIVDALRLSGYSAE